MVKKRSSLFDYSKKYKKDKFIRIVSQFVLFLLTIALGFAAAFFTGPYFGLTISYLLLTAIVGLNAWLFDFRLALFTASVFTVLLWSFSAGSTDLNTILNFFAFLVASIFISLIIDKSKNTDLVKRYKKKEEEYAKSFLSLHKDYDRVKGEVRARDEFLSIASHELKTPLTSMLLQLERMLHNIRNAPLAKFSVAELMKTLANAEIQIRKLAKMINDLLNVSLITTGRLNLDLEQVDLSGVVKEVVKNSLDILKREGYKVYLDAKVSAVGKWDKLRIEQVITNFLSNAIKYGQGKPIEIKVTNRGSLARFRIKDQGIGIAPDQKSALFEKFKRGDEKEQNKGLGVGLYIANQIIKAHKGEIKVISKPKKGATFVVDLPLSK